jgi:protein TonB
MDSSVKHRIVLGAIVAALHLGVIFFAAFSVESAREAAAESADVMKLVDLDEAPPPPPETPSTRTVSEALAENMLETETEPDIVAAAPYMPSLEAENYVLQSDISVLPEFDEKAIFERLVYPPIARRSGIEGRVLLELFINRQGFVTRVNVLREEPPDRGFAEAAVRAFSGAQAKPALANGQVVAVRYRYPVRFQLR